MRLSTLYTVTKKSVADGLSDGQAILNKGGYFIQSDMAGVYASMPLGDRVLNNIKNVIQKELEAEDFSTVTLPILQSRLLWERSGRWSKYMQAESVYSTADGRGMEGILAPTAEESAIQLMEHGLTSYKSLPLKINQIGEKFRNETRVRGGMLRSRAFIMQDAYSADLTEADMDRTFESVVDRYNKIFNRLGLPVKDVEADSGTIGGSGSREFIFFTELGDDTVISCPSCGYAANSEKAVGIIPAALLSDSKPNRNFESVHTPGIKSVEQLAVHFDVHAQNMIKTILYRVVGSENNYKYVAAAIRGDLEVNECKLKNIVDGAIELIQATPEEVLAITGAEVGFAGPIDLHNIPVFFDASTADLHYFLCGVNKTDYHAINVKFGRDLIEPSNFFDFALIEAGHKCKCGGNLEEKKGIELGHAFKLGTTYSKTMGMNYRDKHDQVANPYMGCFGIGVTRTAAIAAEHFALSSSKVVWPAAIAPFLVHIIPVSASEQIYANHLYEDLKSMGYSVLLEDRTSSFGSKLFDADLIGSPVRLVCGRKSKEDIVELTAGGGNTKEVTVDQLAEVISLYLNTNS